MMRRIILYALLTSFVGAEMKKGERAVGVQEKVLLLATEVSKGRLISEKGINRQYGEPLRVVKQDGLKKILLYEASDELVWIKFLVAFDDGKVIYIAVTESKRLAIQNKEKVKGD